MWVRPGAAADSRANALCREQGLQGRVMWFDAEANLLELSTREGVAETIAKCKDCGINTVIVDVKPLSGLVLYNSRIAPRLTESKGIPYPREHDLLQTVIEEGHKAGIAVHAAINVFSEGSQRDRGGPAFDHPEWQCVEYAMDRWISTSDGTRYRLTRASQPASEHEVCLYVHDPDSVARLSKNTSYAKLDRDGRPVQYGIASGFTRLNAPEGGHLLVAVGEAGEWIRRAAGKQSTFAFEGERAIRRVSESRTAHHAIFVNPLHPEARAYALSIIEEICANYAIDGIIFDRMRYPNIHSDFSELTRSAFERELGRAVRSWPDDVYIRNPMPKDDIVEGPVYGEWLKFRAKVIRDFLAEARGLVKSTRPDARVGIYVGSWYPLYNDVGVNWASPANVAGYDWWPEGYEQTGYADLLDYLMTGCYYPDATRRGALAHGAQEWASVEAAAEESIAAVKDATFVYGSLYLFQYHANPEAFAAALRQCLENTQGCMFFDLVYVRRYDWWSIIKEAFATPAQAPHEVPALLERLRS